MSGINFLYDIGKPTLQGNFDVTIGWAACETYSKK
jgi:hypothetical protein